MRRSQAFPTLTFKLDILHSVSNMAKAGTSSLFAPLSWLRHRPCFEVNLDGFGYMRFSCFAVWRQNRLRSSELINSIRKRNQTYEEWSKNKSDCDHLCFVSCFEFNFNLTS